MDMHLTVCRWLVWLVAGVCFFFVASASGYFFEWMDGWMDGWMNGAFGR